MKLLSVAMVLAVSLAAAVNLTAEEPKKGKRPERPQAARGMDLMRMFRGLDLSADQMEKLQALAKEYAPKFKAIDEKRDNIPTEEQKKARAEARREAVKAGKKGMEVFEAAQAAMKLTDEQKAAFAEVQKERMELYREMVGKALEVLTPEQREQIKKRLERFQDRKPRERENV